MEENWFQEYRKLGGLHDRSSFDENVRVFFDTCSSAFIQGLGDEELAFWRWVIYIGRFKEAYRYFNAVNNVTPLKKSSNV